MKQKIYYPIEEQINDCYNYLGVSYKKKDAHEMNEAELAEAEIELRNDFVWVEHPDYIQAVPKNIRTGTLLTPNKKVEQECSCCGHRFWLMYWADGTYTYLDDSCDCEAEFYPVEGSPSISEWLAQIGK